MLMCFGMGAVLLFINFLALRQVPSLDALFGRMTSTMRWLILIPAGPGALVGGYARRTSGLAPCHGYRRRGNPGAGAMGLAACAHLEHPGLPKTRICVKRKPALGLSAQRPGSSWWPTDSSANPGFVSFAMKK